MKKNEKWVHLINPILSMLMGMVGTWMILGTYPFWLNHQFFARIIIFILVFLLTSTGFFCLFALNLHLMNGINKKHKLIKFILISSLLALTIIIGFRHEIPFSFSPSIKLQYITITQEIDSRNLNSCNDSSNLSLTIKPGKFLFRPFTLEKDSCRQDGQSIIREIQYGFFKNRLTARSNLGYSGPAATTTVQISSSTLDEPLFVSFDQTGKNSTPLRISDDRVIYFFAYGIDLVFTFFCLVMLFGFAWWLWLQGKKLGKSLVQVFVKFLCILSERSTVVQVLPFFIVIGCISVFAETALNAFIWFISASSIVMVTLMLLSIFRITSWTGYIIGFSLLSYANIILVTQLSGLIGMLNRSWPLLALHILILAIVTLFYVRAKKPPITLLKHGMNEREISARVFSFLSKNPEILTLMVATGICYLIIALLIIVVPSNIDDILTTYLPRVGYWLQQGSFNIWPTSDYNLPQIVYPLTGQLPLAWQIKLWGNDSVIGFLQYLSIPMGLARIYGLSKLTGASRRQGLFAALLYLGLPLVVILSSTALTDLLAANSVIAFIYLLIKGIKENDRISIILSSLAFGIVLGIKQTVLFLVPGLLILLIILYFKTGKNALKPLMRWIGLSLFTFILFSSFVYIRNFIIYNNFFGPSELIPYFTHSAQMNNFIEYLSQGTSNLLKIIIKPLFDNLPAAVSALIEKAMPALIHDQEILTDFMPRNIYQSSIAWSGQVGFLLLITTFFSSMIYSIKQKKWVLLGVILVSLTYTVALILIRKFTVASILAASRYLLLAAILLIPLVHLVIKKKLIRNLLVINSILMMAATLLFDGAKPLIGQNAIWGKTQNDLRSLQFENTLADFNVIDEFLPEKTTIGFLLPDKFPQSYLFGNNFSRTVIQLDPEYETIKLPLLQSQGIEFLLVSKKLVQQGIILPELTILNDDPASTFIIYKVPASDTVGMD